MKQHSFPRVMALLPILAVAGCGTFPYGTYSPLPSSIDQEVFALQYGQLDQAIALSSQMIAQQPADYRSYSLRGLAYFKKGLYDQAIADYSKALALKPDIRDLYADRGYAYVLAGRNAEAVPDFDKALSMREETLVRARRALALFYLGRYADSVADAEKALAGDLQTGQYALRQPVQDDRAWAELARAGSLSMLGQYQKSADDFDRYAKTSGKYLENESFMQARGAAEYRLGRLDEARAIASRFLELEPRLEAEFGGEKELGFFDLEKRGAVWKESHEAAQKAEAAGDWAGAFEALRKAWGQYWTPEDDVLRRDFVRVYPKLAVKPTLPENAQRYVVQAKTYIKDQNDPNGSGYWKAEESYNKLLSIAPWFPDTYYNAALVWGQLQRYEWAIADMKVYMLLAPDAPDARAAQNKIYEWETRAK